MNNYNNFIKEQRDNYCIPEFNSVEEAQKFGRANKFNKEIIKLLNEKINKSCLNTKQATQCIFIKEALLIIV